VARYCYKYGLIITHFRSGGKFFTLLEKEKAPSRIMRGAKKKREKRVALQLLFSLDDYSFSAPTNRYFFAD